MNVFRILLATLLSAVSMCTYADLRLATGGVYGGPGQKKAYCYVSNNEPTSFDASGSILREDGAGVTSGSSCLGNRWRPRGALTPKGTCVLEADIQAGYAYGCVITISVGLVPAPGAPKWDVRGTMDIRDGSDHVLVSSPLR
jgi:hypothetical protein